MTSCHFPSVSIVNIADKNHSKVGTDRIQFKVPSALASLPFLISGIWFQDIDVDIITSKLDILQEKYLLRCHNITHRFPMVDNLVDNLDLGEQINSPPNDVFRL